MEGLGEVQEKEPLTSSTASVEWGQEVQYENVSRIDFDRQRILEGPDADQLDPEAADRLFLQLMMLLVKKVCFCIMWEIHAQDGLIGLLNG